MKKVWFIVFTVLFFAKTASAAGWEISFCERDSVNVCLGESELFYWSEGQTKVFAMVKNEQGMAGSKLQFKVFEAQGNQNGDIYADLKTYIRPEWKSVSRRISFIQPGYYKVEVYDENLNRLVTGFITITDRPD